MNIFLGHNFYSFYNLNKTSTGLLLSKTLVIPPNVKLKEFQKRLIHPIANITHTAINCTQYQKQKTLIFMSHQFFHGAYRSLNVQIKLTAYLALLDVPLDQTPRLVL